MRTRRKTLGCWIGFHNCFLDSSIIRSAWVCNNCGKPESQKAADALKAERERIMALPKGASIGKIYAAAHGVFDPNLLDDVEAE